MVHIRKLALQAESLVAQTEEVEPFHQWFNTCVYWQIRLTKEMAFNDDETDSYSKLQL